jgi:Cu2+-exporting ATPase
MPFAVSPPVVTCPLCVHCSSPIPSGHDSARFCCAGCEAVHGLLVERGLTRYYALAGTQVTPAAVASGRSLVWLEPLVEQVAKYPGALKTLELDVQGIHCAACVWLFNETFRRAKGAAITVNPALGRLRLQWDPQQLELSQWVHEIEAFGYALGPVSRQGPSASTELPLRLGICAAITLNVMLFSVSFYFGLAPGEGELFAIFSRLSMVLSTAVVLIGGWPFFRGALRGLKSGMLHLDLPIALGIVLVWGTCLLHPGADAAYFDTLNVFITLMLLGRWLQQRVLQANRRFLLDDDGAQGLFVRRRRGARVEVVPAPKIRAGDALLIASGDLIPVDARAAGPVLVSTDWITGESSPRELKAGDLVPAGSFNAGHAAFTAIALTDFAQSSLVALLRQPPPAATVPAPHLKFWNRLARRWVAQVLLASGVGFLLWLPAGAARALDVATALLVVTCPCAIGIALPLAYELTQARLRRRGFFVRSTDLLDRLTEVRTVVFDKTGTLTLGHLALAAPAVLEQLGPRARNALWNLVCRSSHPVSGCLQRALERYAPSFDPDAQIVEVPGAGMMWSTDDCVWRLGRAGWAIDGASEIPHAVLTRDREVIAQFELREALRPDAMTELQALRSDGFDVRLLSGDTAQRVAALADRLGLEPRHAQGTLSPQAKADQVRGLGGGVLYLGDGVNDAPAFAQALCAGTPAIERPVMPARSDFFLVGAGLGPLRDALSSAVRLRRVVRRVLALSLGYNTVAVAICLAGWMSPVKAAIFMPVSSLSLLLITIVSLDERARSRPAPLPLREVPA